MIADVIKSPAVTPAAANALGDPLDHISPSRLKQFLSCRLKFFFEKVLGLKAPVSPALHVGKAVHAGLEAFHKAAWRGQDHSADTVVAQYLMGYEALEAEGPVDYEDADERAKCLADGERVLRAYLASDYARDAASATGVEVALHSADIGLPIPLVGVIDLVRPGNVPVDFKTPASTPAVDQEAWQHLIQLTAYGMLLRDATGEEPGRAQVVYLVKLAKQPKIIVQQMPEITRAEEDRFRALVDIYVQAVDRGEYYPSVGMACGWCKFRSECAKWVGKAA